MGFILPASPVGVNGDASYSVMLCSVNSVDILLSKSWDMSFRINC